MALVIYEWFNAAPQHRALAFAIDFQSLLSPEKSAKQLDELLHYLPL